MRFFLYILNILLGNLMHQGYRIQNMCNAQNNRDLFSPSSFPISYVVKSRYHIGFNHTLFTLAT